ncbi:hypothetical protein EVAR_61505_1 [Eumeta japonica]|uniref:Uncharacterized protein n=1 Tax=Eumeta variegata TaxID=151549 RepID=A0A4C2A5E3_EUMVA|nr:hypothetical protein EVAR_61505_1 [Eumeta japonica]
MQCSHTKDSTDLSDASSAASRAPRTDSKQTDTSAPRTLAPVPTKAAPAIVAVPARTIVAYPPYVTRSIKLISPLPSRAAITSPSTRYSG